MRFNRQGNHKQPYQGINKIRCDSIIFGTALGGRGQPFGPSDHDHGHIIGVEQFFGGLVDLGKGYVAAAQNRPAESPVGLIPIDAVFSPVRKVAYKVDNSRVGQVTDFDKLSLDVTTNVGFAAYFEGLGRVGLMEDNKDDKSVFISGTKVREQLVAGEQPDPRIMRESTAKVLVDYYRSAGQ